MSPIDDEVSTTRAVTVPAPEETAAPVLLMRSMTAATPPVTFWTRESVTVRFSPMRLSDPASVPSSSSPSFCARAVRSQSDTRRATALIASRGRKRSCDTNV